MNRHYALRPDRRRNRITGCAVPVLLAIAMAAPAAAQQPGLLGEYGAPLHGIRLYNVSAFSTWQSIAAPNNGALLPYASRLGSDVSYGGSATVGWAHPWPRSNFSLVYTSSYTGRFRYSEWNALNHSLRLSASRRLNAKWSMGFSVSSAISNYENLLYTPTLYSTVASFGGTFEDLAAAILSGKYTNDQLASLLTGAPIIESPAATLLFGNRVMNAAASTSLSYAHSPRLSLHWSLGGGRLQHLSDPERTDGGRYPYLVPRANSAHAGMGFSYSISPRTTVGIDAMTNRSFSPISDSYYTSLTGSIGRTFGRRWFARVHAGTGFITPLNDRYSQRQSTRPVGGVTLGYKLRSQTFVASYTRIVGDSYGVGSGDSATISGGWQWWQPGRSWGLNAGYGRQDMHGGLLGGLNGWRASMGLSRMLGRHAMIQTGYAYGSYAGHYFNGPYASDQHSVRLTVVWSPQPMGQQ